MQLCWIMHRLGLSFDGTQDMQSIKGHRAGNLKITGNFWGIPKIFGILNKCRFCKFLLFHFFFFTEWIFFFNFLEAYPELVFFSLYLSSSNTWLCMQDLFVTSLVLPHASWHFLFLFRAGRCVLSSFLVLLFFCVPCSLTTCRYVLIFRTILFL